MGDDNHDSPRATVLQFLQRRKDVSTRTDPPDPPERMLELPIDLVIDVFTQYEKALEKYLAVVDSLLSIVEQIQAQGGHVTIHTEGDRSYDSYEQSRRVALAMLEDVRESLRLLKT